VIWGDPTNQPPGSPSLVAISAGRNYSLGIASDGSLVDWGSDPGTPPAGLSNVVAVTASYLHSMALRRDGTVALWGDPGRGWSWNNMPDGLTNVVAISSNGGDDGEQCLVLNADGTVLGWGNVTDVPTDLTNATAIAAGSFHDLALRQDGTVLGWGDDTYGQTDVAAGLSNVVAIAAGEWHSLALTSDGTVHASGFDAYGEVTQADGLSNIVAIAAGSYRTLALRSDGTVFACGNIAVPPDNLTNAVAISAGWGQNLALTLPLQIISITRTNQSAVLRFHTFSGQQYNVEYSPDLSLGSWLPVAGGDVSGDGHDAWVTDINALSSADVRFYRLKR
jgi:alpha-tubulin suppressor-like RCC1 family protein